MPTRFFDAAVANIAAGLEPCKCTLFVNSEVPEHTELAWMFGTVTMFGALAQMTQFKQKARQQERNVNVGLFTYLVFQAAGILLYKASAVPVGEDQVQHIELTREIARNFNARYREIFPEFQAYVSEAKRTLGLDGENKMSKSLGNAIDILETPENIWRKLAPAKTDERRKRKEITGVPEDCNIYMSYHPYFWPPEDLDWVREGYTTAGIGYLDCKNRLLENMKKVLGPIRRKVGELRARPEEVNGVLSSGAQKARKIASGVIAEAKAVIGLVRPTG